MPMHDWTRVEAGIFHAFHHRWISAIDVRDEHFQLPEDKPLTLVAYECGLTTRAYIELMAVGDSLPEMPLFLEPDGYVNVPLNTTYQTAFDVLPLRWRNVLEPPTSQR